MADDKFVPNYFRPSPDKRLIFGVKLKIIHINSLNLSKLVRKRMIKVYPQLENTQIDFVWGGTLAVTRSRLPYFAKIKQNAFSVSGYSGHWSCIICFIGKNYC